jgi:hypothetical protein
MMPKEPWPIMHEYMYIECVQIEGPMRTNLLEHIVLVVLGHD